MNADDLTPEEAQNLFPGAVLEPTRETKHRELLDQINSHHNPTSSEGDAPSTSIGLTVGSARKRLPSQACAPSALTAEEQDFFRKAGISALHMQKWLAGRLASAATEHMHSAGRDVAAAYKTGLADARRNDAVAERALRDRIKALLPTICWISKAEDVQCTTFIGAEFGNGEWTEEMCCVPCRIRRALAAHDQPCADCHLVTTEHEPNDHPFVAAAGDAR